MRFRKCMVVLILLGVLITGAGVGIAFAEYSTFDYRGEVVLAEEEMTEKRLVWNPEMEAVEELRVYGGYEWEASEPYEIVKDRTVPVDEVWFDVTYNQAYGEPELGSTEIYEASSHPVKRVAETNIYIHRVDTEKRVRTLIEGRDRLLADLKEKQFSTYEFKGIYGVKIHVNPKNYEIFRVLP